MLDALAEVYGRRRPPERARLHEQLARIAIARGDLGEALSQLEVASGIDVEHTGILRLLGDVARDAGQHERAERAYRMLLLLLRNQAPVDDESPAYAEQEDTAVARGHRGHRLGLLLKAEMCRWLLEAEPEVQHIDTWNAESNTHMRAVNRRLGYQVIGRSVEYQRRI